MSSERAGVLADEFAAANAEAIAFARSCSEVEWATTVPGEDWSVGVVMHHIAEGHANAARWIEDMAGGDGVIETGEDIDRANAEHAARAISVGRSETVVLLQEGGTRLEHLLRGLSDEQLDRSAPFGPAGGRIFTTADLAPVTARHTREHLGHARDAVRPSS